MTMAAELPRPGVEVVQEFRSVSPTIVTPTLVPCNIAPFFEIIEALNSDGTLNSNAKLKDLYEQLEMTVSQSSFPSPRGNIDEVNVLEETVRTFFEFGGALVELSRTEAFLTSYLDPDVSANPFIRGNDIALPDPTSGIEPPTGYPIDGRYIVLCLDSHTSLSDTDFHSGANLPTAKNVHITFAATVSGGTLTLDEVVDQINALLPGVASVHTTTNGRLLQLNSTRYGAKASIVARKGGTANSASSGTNRLGFSTVDDTLAVGSGFYADDDSDGDQTSPRLKIYPGSKQVLQSSYPGDPQTAETSPFVDSAILSGDNVFADGVSIGTVVQVETDTLTMEVEQTLISNDQPFAPRRVWVRANGLSYPAPASSSFAKLTGNVQTGAATQAYVVSQQPSMQSAAAAAESLNVNVVQAGVVLPTFTVSTGAGWADLAAAVAGINGTADVPFEAYYANQFGEELPAAYYTAHASTTYLGLRTKADNVGSGAAITVVSSTIPTILGFTSLPAGDVGENVRFKTGTHAQLKSINAVSAFLVTASFTYTVTRGGVALTAETVAPGICANLAACVTAWNSKARHTEAFKCTSAGVESTTGTYLGVRTRGENVGGAGTCSINLTADHDATFAVTPPLLVSGTNTNLDGMAFKWSLDFNPQQFSVTLVADEDDGGTSLAQVLSKINALTPNVARPDPTSPPFLIMASNKYGEASQVKISATVSSTANVGLGFDPAPSPAVGNGRPNPDMAIDIEGHLVIQSQLLRDGLTGQPFSPGFSPIIVAYKGLRLDLSPDADHPSLLVVDDISTLQKAADPVSTDNPGAVMMFLSLINAPAVSVAGIGVPEVSTQAPDGTPLGYAKCAEFLENEEVYALATASQNPVVHQTFLTHVNAMSEPEQKGERIYFFNPKIPTRALPTLVGSGTDSNSTPNANELTLDVNLAPALIAAGIDPNHDINPASGPIVNQVYIDLSSSDQHFLVQRVTAGTVVTLRTTFVSGDGNDDAFFSSEALPGGIISDSWTVYSRGAELLIPGTTKPDKNAIAETIQKAAQAYGFRRGYYVHPDQVAINVTGLEQVVAGYYGTACIVGMVGQQPPQQGFTNFPITGLTRVVGSSDFFTQRQLNVVAAGGVYILIQDAQGAPVVCRHQLSTDLTSIETRELSITKVVDYVAKFMRAGLRNFIGRSNITHPFLDNLSTVVSGQLNFLVAGGVLIGADINNILQDADAPDTVLIDVTLDVPFPCNFIRLTLVV
jgi:hypothetical protein